MNDNEEAMERRKQRADYIDHRVKDMLWRLLMMDFRLTYNEFKQEIEKRNKKLKKKEVAAADRDNDLEEWLERQASESAEQVAKHIVNFLREQLVRDPH